MSFQSLTGSELDIGWLPRNANFISSKYVKLFLVMIGAFMIVGDMTSSLRMNFYIP